MSPEDAAFKVKNQPSGAWAAYRSLVYGEQPLGRILLSETLTLLFGGLPGPAGLFLRAKLYPMLFKSCGKKVVFGRNITLRHTHKITIGDGVVVDDQAVLDAKGSGNRGITLGNRVYVGRNTIIYCKGGDIELGERTNLSANCTLFSSNDLAVGAGTMVAAYCYLLSGGEYDAESDIPFADQNGMETKGPCRIGSNCWLGARVTILDGTSLGNDSIAAAGAVVKGDHPAGSRIGGIPAKSLVRT
jgi:acetyltransferase-like isoleucine patch superfamily enzyme